MAVLDLQSNCNLPRIYLHLCNISCYGMVCTEGKMKFKLNSYCYPLVENKYDQLQLFPSIDGA